VPANILRLQKNRQLCHVSGLLVDLASNQNAPSTKNDDSHWLMACPLKATSNQMAQSTKNDDSHWGNLVSSLARDKKSKPSVPRPLNKATMASIRAGICHSSSDA
jgi:hypothetical protein